MKKITVLVAAVLLGGCAIGPQYTMYQPEQPGGGYTDIPMSGGRYQISVRGNGFTDRQQVLRIALVRAAEITLDSGKKYFEIVESNAEEKNKTVDLVLSNEQMHISNHYAVITIKPIMGDPTDGAIDASAKISELAPLVGYTGKYAQSFGAVGNPTGGTEKQGP